jgi:hypothetical protein
MDLLLAICQAIGLALAVGVGGPPAGLFIAAMAKIHAGIDVRGTDWEFLGSTWFLVLMVILTAFSFYGMRSDAPRRVPQAAFAAVFGALAGGASLVEQGEGAAIGVIFGLLVGAGSALIATDVLVGAQRRAARPRRGSSGDPEAAAAATLDLIFAVAGIAIAIVALFLPPLSLLGIVGLAVLASGRRRRASEKYEGLRVLR